MRLFVALVAGCATLAALAGPRAQVALACSCAAVDPARDLGRYDAAFVGTVLSHRVEHPNAPLLSSADPAFWTFDVERAVKGALPRRLVVTTAAEGASCGLELERGDRVALLLTREHENYSSGLCSQTDPDVLARNVVPGARVLATSSDRSTWWWLAGAGGGALAAVALGAVLLRRRGP